MDHPHFSVKRISGFRCDPGKNQSLYWDGYAPGLGLRVTKAGVKSFIFEGWLHGRSFRLTIGDLRTWTLGKAQEEATRLKTLTDRGIDPRQVRADQEAAADVARRKMISEAVLVGDAWTAYLNHHAKRWGARHMTDHRNLSQAGGVKRKRATNLTVQGVLYPLMHMRMADISAQP